MNDWVLPEIRCWTTLRLGALLCSLVLSGCIPTISTFYDIAGAGEKRYTAGCSMNTETDLSIHLTNSTDVVFWGPAARKSTHQMILSIMITVSGDEVVLLTKPAIEITSKEAKSPLLSSVTTIRRAGALSSPSCDPPEGSVYQTPDEPMRRMPGTYHSRPITDSVFVIDVPIPGNQDEFSVQVGPVKVDDKIVEIPAVHFVRKTKGQLVGAFSGSTIG
jgi:hypothetical protein